MSDPNTLLHWVSRASPDDDPDGDWEMLQPVGLSLEDVAALRAENQALRSENVQLRSSVELAIGALRQARFTEMADSLRKELKALDAAHRAPELDS